MSFIQFNIYIYYYKNALGEVNKGINLWGYQW